MSRIRVLHLTSYCTVGGAEMHLLSLLAGLNRDRYEPTLAFFTQAPDEARSLVGDFQRFGVRTVDLGASGRGDLGSLLRLGRLLREGRFQIVHTHSLRAEFGACLWKLMTRQPPVIVTTVHNAEPIYRNFLVSKLLLKSRALVDRVIVISDAVADYLCQTTGIERGRMVRVYYGLAVPNGPHPSGASKSIRDEFGLDPDEPLMGLIGRLAPQKGHEVLFEALPEVAKEVPGVRLLVIGHEDRLTVAQLRQRASDFGAERHVIFCGFRSDVNDILPQLDFLVMPSLWEGFGLVILEAMAAKKPVIATQVGPIPEIVVQGKTGILVPPKDPSALARAILQLLRDRDLTQRLGRAGYERLVEHFTVDKMVRQVERVYEGLLSGVQPDK